MAKEKQEEKKQEEKNWIVGDVATETKPVIYNKQTEESLELHEAMALILDKLDKIQKATVG